MVSCIISPLVLLLSMMDSKELLSGKPNLAQPLLHCCFGGLLVGLAENRQSLIIISRFVQFDLMTRVLRC
jgi:hypothetical protein